MGLQWMSGDEIRRKYLEFFAVRDHLVLPSASLVPDKDPSLLLIGAGMAPFKSYFTGQADPPHSRLATCQKCVRTGDLENVGRTARHHTFFEMLGNFSFADYFKEEAIAWAWEFMTRELGVPLDQLWVSIYLEDDEAFSIWRHQVGVPEERIVRLGKEDNFWEIGTGPCGPCSEIYVDQGPAFGCGSSQCAPGCDCDRYLEVWNLVFTQFDRDEEGNYHPLPRKNIDTGMGLERMAAVMQQVGSNFETDLIRPVIDHVAGLAGVEFRQTPGADVSLQVIADHVRAVTHLVADGVLPGNEGRGYVLRRLLRRAVRHGVQLSLQEPFLHQVVGTVIANGRETYPELAERSHTVTEVVRLEEERFHSTLQGGTAILEDMLDRLESQGQKVLPGEDAFRLYDTYGFPLDLTREMVADRGYTVDEDGFGRAMEEQRQRARAAWQGVEGMKGVGNGYPQLDDLPPTEFTGYETLVTPTRILAVLVEGERVKEAETGARVDVVLEKSPFYPESGGQVGDTGRLAFAGGEVTVEDTHSPGAGIILHRGVVRGGSPTTGQEVEARVEQGSRAATARNHTATHLLHWALRQVLGEHVEQAGSLVSYDRLRFDFSHYQPLEPEEMRRVEDLTNQLIRANIQVEFLDMTLQEARERGVIALFGEKYGERVRVVRVGDVSMELCGGTHVSATGSIGMLALTRQESVGAGFRRLEAVTGAGALEYLRFLQGQLEQAAQTVRTSPEELVERLQSLQGEMKQRERELEAARMQLARQQVSQLLDRVQPVDGVKVLAAPVEARSREDLLAVLDDLKGQFPDGVIILGSAIGDRASFVCRVAPDLVQQGLHAGNIVREVAQVARGGGGGKPDLAQAGGKDPERVPEAVAHGLQVVRQQVGEK